MPEPTRHTLILSDMHLSDAEPLDPRRPLWKRFKRRDLFADASFSRLLQHARALSDGAPMELILNGDIFDFDSVMVRPDDGRFDAGWLERRRGLNPEQPRSAYKMGVILGDHPGFIEALRAWVLDGHTLAFVIGNHDLELHWPAVQQVILDALELPADRLDAVRFCEWFLLSGEDTLVTHGNQFDRYCVCQDPVHPIISVNGRARVRLPFGNLAGKFMLNGMGLFNPHVESSFIKSAREYLVFFYRYLIQIQPFLLVTWFWTACVTLVVVLTEGLRPALRDPLTMEDRVEHIARKARVKPRVVRTLAAVDVHPAVFNPWMIARELWLDRALLFLVVSWGSFQIFSTLVVFANVSFWWFVATFVVLVLPFLFYASRVRSDVDQTERAIAERLSTLSAVTGVDRVIMGHTHIERHTRGPVEYINTGNWSPAFLDVDCTVPFGRRCFAWLAPGPDGARTAELRQWQDPGSEVIQGQGERVERRGLRLRLPERHGAKKGG